MDKIALGTVQFGLDYGINNKSGQVKYSEVNKILETAYKKNINLLDTSIAYGNSEQVIGDILKQNKYDFAIVTKYYNPKNIKFEQVINNSLNNLNQKSINGYLLHHFNVYENNKNIWNNFIQLKRNGITEKTGFSLYHTKELEIILEDNIEFDIVQIPYSIFDRRFEDYFEILSNKKVEINVRSVFLQGLVFKKEDELSDHFSKIKPKLRLLQQISAENNLPISSICINFAVNNKFIDKVIIGVDNNKNLCENLKSLEDKEKDCSLYDKLDFLKEKDENIILPINWR